MIQYLGVWAVAAQAHAHAETIRRRRRQADAALAPDALIGAEITTQDGVIPASGRTVAGWKKRNVGRASRSPARPGRKPVRPPVLYVGVAQLAARWDTARITLDAALVRSQVIPDAGILLADGRRVLGFLPSRLRELDTWAASALHRPSVVRHAGPGRPRINEPTGAEIAALVEQGRSLRDIAAETGLSRETVRTRYREHLGHGSGPSA